MPHVTALAGRGRRVAVELDGVAWRTLPAEAVFKAGLSVGIELDRERARTLRRELRRSEALERSARALRSRDRSERELEQRLERAGFTTGERREALGTMTRIGLVDDGRVAQARAAALAERGKGDRAIRWDLEQRGLPPALVEEALAALEPERDRATALVERGVSARSLAQRGFDEEAVEAAVGTEG